ncbi:regulator of volume decrease after cellular swelling-domain-containing protein [Microdochium trichocladiopsis]|uniref:Regulator of volume decrease after cellular swelling-domain-containing protein n=1 Tax=Microdochium trichocladiopsis TaxID=1682393 RepID=A0A9P9BRR8_9PEZI|nr:regulator of volume decrease after cellular swelling-domain-containing protein [Microdochium trichocladiopsis]KAH7033100.1 regulator of volume decrease after cellular swelling-domain-containing protein [Microdochium trichocladiopsis]
MLATVIKTCPSAETDFEQLSEYQSQTPQTFFDGKPVLHAHDKHVKAWVSEEQHERLFFFSKDSTRPSSPHNAALEGNGQGMVEDSQVEVFVASNKLTLFSRGTGMGIEIPYPAITLHAVKHFKNLGSSSSENASANTGASSPPLEEFDGVYMQLEFSDTNAGADDDESFEPIELTLVPYVQAPTQPADSSAAAQGTSSSGNADRTKTLFTEISRCSNLNPDPRDGDEDDDEYIDDEGNADRIVFEGDHEAQFEVLDGFSGAFRGDSGGGLPPPMPGSSGWITAENVDQYFDAEGNWIGGGDDEEGGVSGELGEGAGRVRGRDEVEGGEAASGQNGVNGHHADEDGDGDAKRPRVE